MMKNVNSMETKPANKKDMHKGAAIACGLLALGFLLIGNFLAFFIFLAVALSAAYLYFKVDKSQKK